MTAARRSVPIPTASMADIAFLLLVFFLVAASIQSDAGLPVTLPPVGAGADAVPSLLTVLVDAEGRVLLDGRPVAPADVRAGVAAFARTAEAPRVAVQAARATPYDAYVAALDAVLMGHRDAGATPRLTLREPAGTPEPPPPRGRGGGARL